MLAHGRSHFRYYSLVILTGWGVGVLRMLPRKAVVDIKRLAKQLGDRYTHAYRQFTRACRCKHTCTQKHALTNPNQSLGNVLSAMQGNNMSFSTYKQTENSETTRQMNGHTTTSLLFLFHLERTFFMNATSRRTAARQLRAHDMKAEAVSGQILRRNTRDVLFGFSLFLEWCLHKTASTLHLEKDTAETSVYGH